MAFAKEMKWKCTVSKEVQPTLFSFPSMTYEFKFKTPPVSSWPNIPGTSHFGQEITKIISDNDFKRSYHQIPYFEFEPKTATNCPILLWEKEGNSLQLKSFSSTEEKTLHFSFDLPHERFTPWNYHFQFFSDDETHFGPKEEIHEEDLIGAEKHEYHDFLVFEKNKYRYAIVCLIDRHVTHKMLKLQKPVESTWRLSKIVLLCLY